MRRKSEHDYGDHFERSADFRDRGNAFHGANQRERREDDSLGTHRRKRPGPFSQLAVVGTTLRVNGHCRRRSSLPSEPLRGTVSGNIHAEVQLEDARQLNLVTTGCQAKRPRAAQGNEPPEPEKPALSAAASPPLLP